MNTPIVIELPLRLEAVTRDAFTPPAPAPAPRPAPRAQDSSGR